MSVTTAPTPVTGNDEVSTEPVRRDATPEQPRPLTGFATLLRFMVRRDRLRAPVWFAAVVGLFATSAASVVGLYNSPSELADYASIARADAAIKALTGPGYGLDDPTQGAVVMNEMGMYTLIAVELMCVFLTIRHTRADEKTARAELVRSAPVGRHATLAAATVWVLAVNVVVSTGVTVALVALGLPLVGSVAFGAACAGIGAVLGGVAAVTAQVFSSARAATAVAGGAVGAFFVMRAVGDMGNGWMSWLSPLGWSQAIRAYADERWWALVPLTAAAVGLLAGAVWVQSARDFGAGLIGQRPGPARGSDRLSTPMALAIRLLRTSLIGWTVGVAVVGFFYGIIADEADKLLENDAVADVLAPAGSATPTESFLATIVLMLALIASGYAVSAVLRMRTEEFALRLDPILASPVARSRWMLSYLAVATAGSAVVMAITGLMAGVGYAIQVSDAGEILPLVGAALTMVPALLLLSTLTAAIVGLRPKWSMTVWAAVAYSAVVGLLSTTLNLPQWAQNISPFEHVPAIPAAPFDVLPVVVLVAVAAALTAIGLAGFNHRDIAKR